MAEERSGFDLRRDGGGLVLFGAGAFLAVLSVLALTSDVPPEEARGTSAVAVWWTALLGPVPSLVIAVAAAGLGARAFLAARLEGAGRILLGALGVSAALSIGFSSVSAGAGGALGDAIGGTLSRTTHAVAGVLLALVVLAATAWFAWVREMARVARENAAAMPAPRPSERAESVSSEEAAALLPAERAVLEMVAASSFDASSEVSTEPEPEPPLPYPEDVRLRGEVPDGARPLGEAKRSTAAAPIARAPGLSEAVSVVPLGLPEKPAAAPTWRPRAEVASVEDELDEALPGALAEALEESAHEAETDGPPRPSWEQSSLFGEEIEVDAYGTPLELVEELESAEAGADGAFASEGDEDEDESLDDEDDEETDDEEDEDEDEGEGEDAEDSLAAEQELEEEAELDQDEIEVSEELEEVEPALAEGARDEESEESQVAAVAADDELQPRPMPPGELERRLGGREKLVYEAGQFFLERGRVAVSLLQREYGMTFDEACAILDELQERGLIGPYLGGKHRDILLTSEEWLERVSST